MATTKATTLAHNAEIIDDLGEQSVPHIIPGVLYPAYVASGTSPKLLDGTTTHGTGTYNGVAVSTAYGTVQADGRKYYYTNIAGSKPIKDPRIGGHFGSQRHEIASIQLLEQETATHGSNVYSIDGRNWMRCTGGGWSWINDSHGSRLKGGNVSSYPNMYIEVVGYFNGFNLLHYTDGNHKVRYSLDGATEVDTDYGATSVPTPLGSRYVDPSSVVNIPISTTLGIHTIKLRSNGVEEDIHGIELIAQDTTSTANRSKIQIPSQNVVSYGKKFTVSGTPHYDPFNGFTSGSSVTSYIDTATSLGVEKWKNSSTYYRPYNGGRVVKWVDSSGVIKTSVTLMPPNAKSIGDSSSLTNGTAKANASASNDTFYPTFEAHTTDVNEDNLHEVAKTFHFREFGNGAGNQGSNPSASPSYQDASMLDGYGDIAYVMDDGLTSLSANDVNNTGSAGCMHLQGDGDDYYITFIGTGIAIKDLGGTHGGTDSYKWYIDGVEVKNFTSGYVYPNSFLTVAQNLPYGTHILQVERVTANTYGQRLEEVTFHQPKKPPIPEDACVIADYMLMADFVPIGADGIQYISKGVRGNSISRDVFADTSASSITFAQSVEREYGWKMHLAATSAEDSLKVKLPSFGTNFVARGYGTANRDLHITTGGTETDVAQTAGSSNVAGSYNYPNSAVDLGVHTFASHNIGSTKGNISAFEIVTPIHTSHHYQSFETPYLYELVGGDRNMEQTNLVVSPDNKTWDQLTRDTSYIGNSVLTAKLSADVTSEATLIFDDFRGVAAGQDQANKDFAIAYDRFICLRDGGYNFSWSFEIQANGAAGYARMALNGTYVMMASEDNEGSERGNMSASLNLQLKRGDYVSFPANYYIEGTDQFRQVFSVTRI